MTALLNRCYSTRTSIIYVTDVIELVDKNYHASNKAGSCKKHIIFKIPLDKVK